MSQSESQLAPRSRQFVLHRPLSRGRHGSQAMQGLLFDVGENVVAPASGLLYAEAAIWIANPGISPPAGRKPTVCLLMLQTSQGKLLEVVAARARRAASRAACTAGSSSAIKMPMIVMTTKSSTRVKPECFRLRTRDFWLSWFTGFSPTWESFMILYQKCLSQTSPIATSTIAKCDRLCKKFFCRRA